MKNKHYKKPISTTISQEKMKFEPIYRHKNERHLGFFFGPVAKPETLAKWYLFP